ncbi:MAG: hypothetical protein L0Y72_19855 [Gemmataceae bacterium]|nr:hypothetical protein [Gemmataceae bacterium]MCI0741293.1 hypothetical protein [Gemmataceae bacterium]
MFDSFQPYLLRPAFEQYSTQEGRDRLIETCRSKVTEWRWASGDMAFAFSLKKPFVKELHRSDPNWLKAGATPKRGNVRHGLDAQGVIHVTIDPFFGESEMNEEQGAATYVVYQEAQIEAVTYRYTPGQLESLRRCVYDGERLIREHNLFRMNGSELLYLWPPLPEGERNSGRLDRVLSMGWSQLFRSDSRTWDRFRVTGHSQKRFEYDVLGRLERIAARTLNQDGTVSEGLKPRVDFERPKKSDSIPSLAKDIERMLLEQIPAEVAKAEKAKGKGPFYCLLLCYCGEDFQAGWPVFLLLGSDAERQRIIQCGMEPIYLWAVGEMEGQEANVRLPLRDESLNNYCRLHTQMMDVKEDYSSAMKVLRSVAKALNDLDWSKLIEVTPDFLVAAVDDHGIVNPVDDIKAVISAAKFRTLKQQGLV